MNFLILYIISGLLTIIVSLSLFLIAGISKTIANLDSISNKTDAELVERTRKYSNILADLQQYAYDESDKGNLIPVLILVALICFIPILRVYFVLCLIKVIIEILSNKE